MTVTLAHTCPAGCPTCTAEQAVDTHFIDCPVCASGKDCPDLARLQVILFETEDDGA